MPIEKIIPDIQQVKIVQSEPISENTSFIPNSQAPMQQKNYFLRQLQVTTTIGTDHQTIFLNFPNVWITKIKIISPELASGASDYIALYDGNVPGGGNKVIVWGYIPLTGATDWTWDYSLNPIKLQTRYLSFAVALFPTGKTSLCYVEGFYIN